MGGGHIEPWSRRMELSNCVVHIGAWLRRGAGRVEELPGYSLAWICPHKPCRSSNLCSIRSSGCLFNWLIFHTWCEGPWRGDLHGIYYKPWCQSHLMPRWKLYLLSCCATVLGRNVHGSICMTGGAILVLCMLIFPPPLGRRYLFEFQRRHKICRRVCWCCIISVFHPWRGG